MSKQKVDVTGLADELGMIRAQMAELKEREATIRETFIKAGVHAVEDETFRATVVESMRKIVDWKAVAKKLNPSRQLLTAHTTEKEVVSVRVSARRGAFLS